MKTQAFAHHFKPQPKLIADCDRMLPPQKIRITPTEFYANEIGKPTASADEWQIDMHARGKRNGKKPEIFITQYLNYRRFAEVLLYWIFATCRLYKLSPTEFAARLYTAIKSVEEKGGDIFTEKKQTIKNK